MHDDHKTSVVGYGKKQATQYDEVSVYDKGDREKHFIILTDLLKYLQRDQFEFCDLGCGTGFFTRAFFDVAPNSKGLAIDGSEQMLMVAREKLAVYDSKLDFSCQLFQDINWKNYENRFDIIFSCLAIHHLDDIQKWHLFENLFSALRPGGHFILFDLFRYHSKEETQIIEYLACRDIQRRLMVELGIEWEMEDLQINKIIANDRQVRAAEGDQEAILTDKIAALEKAGFASVITVFQDLRLAGLYCTKK